MGFRVRYWNLIEFKTKISENNQNSVGYCNFVLDLIRKYFMIEKLQIFEQKLI